MNSQSTCSCWPCWPCWPCLWICCFLKNKPTGFWTLWTEAQTCALFQPPLQDWAPWIRRKSCETLCLYFYCSLCQHPCHPSPPPSPPCFSFSYSQICRVDLWLSLFLRLPCVVLLFHPHSNPVLHFLSCNTLEDLICFRQTLLSSVSPCSYEFVYVWNISYFSFIPPYISRHFCGSFRFRCWFIFHMRSFLFTQWSFHIWKHLTSRAFLFFFLSVFNTRSFPGFPSISS